MEELNIQNTDNIMEIKFKEGDEVYERIRPGQKLIISRYFKGIYYCKVDENLDRKELIFAERELMTRKLTLGSIV
jgi:uncharacterized protein YodC (DUF2158 family)